MNPRQASSSLPAGAPVATSSLRSFGAKVWLPVLLLVWTFLCLIFPLYDTDFWWHLKTGEWILAEGWVPQVDLYTFADSDRPWIDLHWGFQLLVAWLYHVGGANLVVLAKAVVLTSAVAVAFCATGKGLSMERRVVCWIPAVICITGRGFERPEMLSLLFLAVWLWIVFHLDRRPWLIWLLPVLQVVWVNCHALFVLGLVVAACGVADWIGRMVLGGRFGIAPIQDEEVANLRSRAIGGLAAFAASLANPYFEEGALFPLTLYRKFSVEQDFYSQQVAEFLPPIDFLLTYRLHAFRNIYFVAEIVVALLAFASVVRQWRRGGGVSLFRLGLLAAFSHLAWKASRNTNLFALVATTVACANFATVAQAVGRESVRTFRSRLAVAGVLIGLSIAVVTGVWNRIGEGRKPFRLGEAADWFIHDAAKFAGQDGMPDLAVVHNFGQASVYIYHNAPERRVLMDGRLEVGTRETFEMLNDMVARMAAGRSDWQALFTGTKTPLPVVILDVETSPLPLLGMLEMPGWRLVYADATAGVFLSDPQADLLKLPAVDRELMMRKLRPYVPLRNQMLERRGR